MSDIEMLYVFQEMEQEIRKGMALLRKNDLIMKNIIDMVGDCTLRPSKDYYNSLVKSIIYQQLSIKAAKTIYNRFLEQLNDSLTPENVLNLRSLQLKKAGISKQKMSYLRDLSEKFNNGDINTSKIPFLKDEELIDLLTSIKGIGRWSAEMFLIFCLNRLDVLPFLDLGFRKSVMINYNLSEMPDKEKILEISKKWTPYRSIAVWYLWQSINQNG